jgi:preprotein translocase subunit SecA
MLSNSILKLRHCISSNIKEELLPHPGIYYGGYPCRKDRDYGVIEIFFRQLSAFLRKPVQADRKKWDVLVNRVHALEKVLSEMSDATLDEWVIDIRKDLINNGLQDEITARAFATIREVASREIGMKHFDSQLIGGWVMLHGMIAEMQTGEGKTLAATLPASCAALAGMPVHIVTVNDYLVERDVGLMRPVYERLGLSVGCVLESMDTTERKQAYSYDIVYCTSKQLAFDYLRDRLILKQFSSDLEFKLGSLYQPRPPRDCLLMRGLNYAIVDEADSVLIDEACTPLILSCKTDNTQREAIHREAVWLARQLNDENYYRLDHKTKHAELTQLGEDILEEAATGLKGVWRGTRRRKTLVEQALVALHLYERDVHYLVDDGKICIIDENTGRIMPDRSWEAGLHQMIEEKEACEQTSQTETLARISYQRFFRRYIRLSGTTGTASEVKSELQSVYDLNVVAIPTNKPVQRVNRPDYIYTQSDAKWQAIVNSIMLEHDNGRPILVGTRTLRDSEHLSLLLDKAELPHQVLNAKQDKEESEIVARAGQSGQITVATNMAGRGTDIKLDEAAIKTGGLHVISCEKNVSARIDRQLAGRCGRQGDPGSYEAILSLEDAFVDKTFGRLISHINKLSNENNQVRPEWVGAVLMRISQRLTEYYYRQIRKAMMQVDDKRNEMLAFTGQSE